MSPDWGNFIIHDPTSTSPIWCSGEKPQICKKNVELPEKHEPKCVRQLLVIEKLRCEGECLYDTLHTDFMCWDVGVRADIF